MTFKRYHNDDVMVALFSCLKTPWVWALMMLPALWLWAMGWAPLLIGLYGGVGAILLLLALVDLRSFFLPDVLVLPLWLAGLVLPVWLLGAPWWWPLLGSTLGAGFFMGVQQVYRIATGSHGLGWGDVKLMGALGAWVGPLLLPPLLVMASLLALPILALRRVFLPQYAGLPLPYGPFLAVGGWFCLLYGSYVWQGILWLRTSLADIIWALMA